MTDIFKSEAGRKVVLDQYAEILANWPVESRQYHVETSHGSTFVVESGDATALPVLLLHGSVSNSFSWIGDVATLSETHRVFAIDIIGEAGLSAPNRPTYESGAYAEWLEELIQGLGLESCSIVGLSLGGWMGLSLAITHPERVDKLFLICAGGICRERRSFLFKAIGYTLLGEWGKKKIIELVNGGKLTEQPGLHMAMSFVSLINQHFRPRFGKLLIFSDEELGRLVMPVSVVFGEFDNLLRAEASLTRMKTHVAQIETTLLPNTGHIIVNQAARIQEFLGA